MSACAVAFAAPGARPEHFWFDHAAEFKQIMSAFSLCTAKLAAIPNRAALEGCVATALNDSKVGKQQQKLAGGIGAKCDMFPPAGLEDGQCSTCMNANCLATCVGDEADCQGCLAINNQISGGVNCDMLDDGAANASCP